MAILSDMLQPFAGLTPEAAAQVAALQVPASVQLRIDQLAQKSNDGVMTADERSDYETLVKYGNMLSVIKAKARVAVGSGNAG